MEIAFTVPDWLVLAGKIVGGIAVLGLAAFGALVLYGLKDFRLF